MATHEIKTLADILELEPDQIERILPALTAWAFTSKIVKHNNPSAVIDTFYWDDEND